MKILQIVPKSRTKLKFKTLLKDKERDLRGRGTTFYREREGRWKHERYVVGSAGMEQRVVCL